MADPYIAPCPFCRSPDTHESSNGTEDLFIVCNTCGGCGPSAPTSEAAVAQWNLWEQPPAEVCDGMV